MNSKQKFIIGLVFLTMTNLGILQQWQISNLSNQGTEFNQDDIFIEKAFVDEGPTMKRFRPRAMGRASQILKRTCHLTLTLTNKNNKR